MRALLRRLDLGVLCLHSPSRRAPAGVARQVVLAQQLRHAGGAGALEHRLVVCTLRCQIGPAEESLVSFLFVLMIMAALLNCCGDSISWAKPVAKPLKELRCSVPLPSENLKYPRSPRGGLIDTNGLIGIAGRSNACTRGNPSGEASPAKYGSALPCEPSVGVNPSGHSVSFMSLPVMWPV